MKIKAKYNYKFDITKDNIYEAIEHDGDYFVTDDSGEQWIYKKEHFDIIEE